MKKQDFIKTSELGAFKLECISEILNILNEKGKTRKKKKVIILEDLDEYIEIDVWEQHGGTEIGYTAAVKSIESIADDPNNAVVHAMSECDTGNILLTDLSADNLAELTDFLKANIK